MARRVQRGFIWVPRDQTTKYKIEVDGTDYTDDAIVGGVKWSKAVFPEVGEFEIFLDNNNGVHSGKYAAGSTVTIYIDFSGGTTKRFVGDVETASDVFGEMGVQRVLRGTHVQGRSLNPRVYKQYVGSKVSSDMVVELFGTWAADFTTDNVSAATDAPVLSWNGVDLAQAVSEIVKQSGFDCYVDDDLDVHYFQRGSVENNTEASVWGDNFISLEGYDTDLVEIKNRARVMGEDDAGLPVLYTSTNGASAQSYRVREAYVSDTKVKSYDEARDRARAEVLEKKDPDQRGVLTSSILPSLEPGDKIWVKYDPEKEAEQFIVSKFEHRLPEEETVCYLQRQFDFIQVFRQRTIKDKELEANLNLNNMDFSYNRTFFDTSGINQGASTGTYEAGEAGLTSSAGNAVVVTTIETIPSSLRRFELRVNGESLDQVSFEYSVQGGAAGTWTSVTPDTLVNTGIDNGKVLALRITFSGSDARLQGVALLYVMEPNFGVDEFSADVIGGGGETGGSGGGEAGGGGGGGDDGDSPFTLTSNT